MIVWISENRARDKHSLLCWPWRPPPDRAIPCYGQGRRRRGGRGSWPPHFWKPGRSTPPPRFENEVVKIRCFFRFLGYFGIGWPPCRRFDPPLKNPWRRPWLWQNLDRKFNSVLGLGNLGGKRHPSANNIPLYPNWKIVFHSPRCSGLVVNQNFCDILSIFIFELLIHRWQVNSMNWSRYPAMHALQDFLNINLVSFMFNFQLFYLLANFVSPK